MTTFAKKAFNAAVYSQARPTYSSELFEHIFSFHRQGSRLHQARWERAVDLGCGTGQATTYLRPFSEVIGIDPSQGMLDKARVYLADSWKDRSASPVYKLLLGSAEDLGEHLPDEHVDLLIAAQACHWFDWSKVWPETKRVLRRGGSAAFWVYTEFRLSQFPSLTPLISEFVQGSNEIMSLGTYFERPGRTILERYLVDVPEPSDILGDDSLSMKRVYFCGSEIPPFLPKEGPKFPILLRREMTWRDLLSYFRTMSALLSYHERFPGDLKAEEDKRFLEEDLATASGSTEDIRGGDISMRFWKDLRQGVLGVSPDSKVGLNDGVQVHWPVALFLVRKN